MSSANFDPPPVSAGQSARPNTKSILEGVTFYHWCVVLIASCGWLFDCMDQRLFTIAKESALKELLGSDAAALAVIQKYLGLATAAMMLGWGTGGIIFGMMSDKIGRVKTMIATLIVYSGFTGLSGLAHSWLDFTIFRFLVGLGVGGMFGSATTLVAESVPGDFRTLALGSLQALSASGNMIGSFISYQIPPGADSFIGAYAGWRALFFIGILPALLIVPILFVLREPEPWKKAKAEAVRGGRQRSVGSPVELFRDPRWRRHTLAGLFLGLAGMVGLWGIGFFSPELITTALKDSPLHAADLVQPQLLCATLSEAQNPAAALVRGRLAGATLPVLENARTAALSAEQTQALAADLNRLIHGPSLYDAAAFQGVNLKRATLDLIQQIRTKSRPADVAFANRQLLEQLAPGGVAVLQSSIDKVRSLGTLLQDVGSFLGMMAFTFAASYFNRRKAFLGAFILCLAATMFVFHTLKSANDAYWMLPIMGFAQLAVFAGYSIYFPELYPTRLRGTGVGFCYNTVRYIAAPFPILLGYLSAQFTFRTAAMLLSLIYLVGLVALLWAPETKDQPLPEN